MHDGLHRLQRGKGEHDDGGHDALRPQIEGRVGSGHQLRVAHASSGDDLRAKLCLNPDGFLRGKVP